MPTFENKVKERSIVMKYRLGHDGLEASKSLVGSSISTFRDGNYNGVITILEGFESDTNGFADQFSEAAAMATSEGHSEVATAARAGADESTAIANAGATLKTAAEFAKSGNNEAADQQLSEAQEYMKTAETAAKDVMSPSEVENQLL